LGSSNAGAVARRLRPEDVDLLREIGRVGARRGLAAFLVGGAVRDALARFPVRDLDVVVEGELARLLEGWISAADVTVRAHERFETASITLPSGARLDFAAARSEEYLRPAVLPRVRRAGLRDDLFRRDFTINAMAMRLGPERFGELVDPFGGRKDVAARTIRILHPRSFVDDPTRAFRAVRLSARLGFSIERATAGRIREVVESGVVSLLSPHRLWKEVEPTLEAEPRVRVVRHLDRLLLLRALHRRIVPTERTYERLRRADRALAWFRSRFPKEELRVWTLPASILASSLRDEERDELIDRLGPDRRSRKILVEGPAGIRALRSRLGGRRTAPSPSRIHGACRDRPVEILLLAMASSPDPILVASIRRHLCGIRSVRADVRGSDLLREGLRPGAPIARGLEAALFAKLDGRARTREEQLAAALEAAREA
jgi:tRNA nucleotidyltransferase (CCA-adding enzyme)